MRTLFVRGGALGDFVLTLPVLDRLIREGAVDVAAPERLLPLLPEGIGRCWRSDRAEAGWIYEGRNLYGYGRIVCFSQGIAEAWEGTGVEVRWRGRPEGMGAGRFFMGVLGEKEEETQPRKHGNT